MEIQTLQKKEGENSPIIVLDSLKLKVGDGIRLGFGFGFGMFLWGVIFLAVVFVGASILIQSLASSIKLF